MRHITWTLALLALAGCPDDADTDSHHDSDTEPVDTEETDAGETDVTVTTCDPESADAGTICTVMGIMGQAQFAPEGLPATQSHLYLPIDMTVAPDGTLYVIDFNNHRIRRVDDDGTVHTLAGSGFLGDGPEGPAATAAFNHPTQIAFHPSDPDLLYISAWHNSRIEKIDLSGSPLQISFECGDGSRAFGGDGGQADVAKLDLPSSIVFDDDGTMYIADSANGIIRKVGTDGVITTVAGTAPTAEQPRPANLGYAGDGGPAADAKFDWPWGQKGFPGGKIVRHDRTIYVADTFNNVVRAIDMDTWQIDLFAGTPEEYGTSGDGGAAVEAKLNQPVDMAVDDAGNVYIADTYNSCVRKVDTDGVITTFAGICGEPGGDTAEDGGPATSAHLFQPYGVEVGNGLLYIADTENHVIRAVKL